MAYRVIWSPRALDDIDSLASYISRDSTVHASAVVSKIIIGNIYKIQGHSVTIAAVIHGNRNLGTIEPPL